VRGTAAALAAAALALALAGCRDSPARPAPALFGFSDSSPLAGQTTPRQSAELSKRAGADSVRVTIDWTHTEGRPGAIGLRPVDAIYRAHVARGIRPLLVVTGAPAWAWGPGRRCAPGRTCGHPPGPGHVDDYARFAATVARRYPRAAGIEIWNEPNERLQWLPAPDPAAYAGLLAAAHDAIEAVAPGMPVIGGSVSANLRDDVSRAGMGLVPFLEGMYEAGAAAKLDGLAVHAYPVPGDHGRGDRAIDRARGVRDARGDDSPLWLTEVGYSSTAPGAGEEEQAEVLAEMLGRLRETGDVRAVYVHTLVEPTYWPEDHPSRGYGVLRPDLSPKPAYCALAPAC